MNEEIINRDDDELLIEYYYRRRKKIIIALIVLLIIAIAGAGTCYLLFFNDPGLKLELTKDEPVIINLSKLSETDMSDYIESYTDSGTRLSIPDISDYDKPGEYTVEYELKSTENNEKITKKIEIKIVDDIAPVLELNVDNYELSQDTDFDFKTLISECSDNIDGNLIDKVQITGYDMSITGMQDVVFTVEDSAGNVTEKAIILNVTEVQQEVDTDSLSEQNDSQSSQNQSSNQSSSSSETSDNSSSSDTRSSGSKTLDGTRFMFRDGYDMGNVMSVCQSTLLGAGETGTCQPIYENGVIVGVEIQQ